MRGSRCGRVAHLIVLGVIALPSLCAQGDDKPHLHGPLRVHPSNPRYFTDGSGRAVYLAGAHTWPNLVDMGPAPSPRPFAFAEYLTFLQTHHHNFVRLWTWESASWDTEANGQKTRHLVQPLAYRRSSSDVALDGKPKFDLTQFEPEYFQRLRDRVTALRDCGIYVSVMLFEGWALQHDATAWQAHPFRQGNNVNGIDGDPNGDGRGIEIHTLGLPHVTRIQEDYVRHVIDTVNDLDNVLYEIANESGAYSTEWQYHMIRFVKEYEKSKAQQHPVGMTFQYSRDKQQRGTNQLLFDSPADWISPNPDGGYRDDPPAADGRKIILNDTDHLWGIGGSQSWVWKSFCRGMNPLFMDPYDGEVLSPNDQAKWEPIRRSLGHTRLFAQRMNLTSCRPRQELASTGYCLANASAEGAEYLVYVPAGGVVSVELAASPGNLRVEWFDPTDGKTAASSTVEGGGRREFTPPFSGDAVLFLSH